MKKKIAGLLLAVGIIGGITSNASAEMVAQDVKQTDPFYSDVQYVLGYNIMKNKFEQPEYNRYEFRPYDTVLRYELAGSFLKFRNMLYWNEFKPLQDQDKAINEKLGNLSSEVQGTKGKISTYEQEINALQTENETLEIENQELKKQLEALSTRVESLEENAKLWNENKPQ